MSEEEFWRLTPHEFDLLLRRHKGDVRWMEAMFAVGPWVTAEINRDKKRHRKPFNLFEWTITGLTTPKRDPKKKRDPASLFAQISDSMRMLGGKDGDSSR